MTSDDIFYYLKIGLNRLDPTTLQEVKKHCYAAGAIEHVGNGPFNPSTFVFDFESLEKLEYNLRVRPNKKLFLLLVK